MENEKLIYPAEQDYKKELARNASIIYAGMITKGFSDEEAAIGAALAIMKKIKLLKYEQ